MQRERQPSPQELEQKVDDALTGLEPPEIQGEDIVGRAQAFLDELDAAAHEIKRIDADTFSPHFHTGVARSQMRKTVSLGDAPVDIEYHTSEESDGWFSDIYRQATIAIITDDRTKDAAFNLDVPQSDGSWSEEQLSRAVEQLRDVVQDTRASPEEERRLLEAVTDAMKNPVLAHKYQEHRMNTVYTEGIHEIRDIQERIEELRSQLPEDTNNPDTKLIQSKLNEVYEERKEEAVSEIKQTVDRAKNIVDDYIEYVRDWRGDVEESLEERREELQRRGNALDRREERLDEREQSLDEEVEALLEPRRRELDEREERLQQELQNAYAILNDEGHTASAYNPDVMSSFDDAFPDHKPEYGDTSYETRVDHDLKLWYAKKIQRDTQKVNNIDTGDALGFLQTLRIVKHGRDGTVEGDELRDLYAGTQIAMAYTERHDEVSLNDVQNRVVQTAFNEDNPRVEHILERSTGQDFQFSWFTPYLHPENAETKDELGIM